MASMSEASGGTSSPTSASSSVTITPSLSKKQVTMVDEERRIFKVGGKKYCYSAEVFAKMLKLPLGGLDMKPVLKEFSKKNWQLHFHTKCSNGSGDSYIIEEFHNFGGPNQEKKVVRLMKRWNNILLGVRYRRYCSPGTLVAAMMYVTGKLVDFPSYKSGFLHSRVLAGSAKNNAWCLCEAIINFHSSPERLSEEDFAARMQDRMPHENVVVDEARALQSYKNQPDYISCVDPYRLLNPKQYFVASFETDFIALLERHPQCQFIATPEGIILKVHELLHNLLAESVSGGRAREDAENVHEEHCFPAGGDDTMTNDEIQDHWKKSNEEVQCEDVAEGTTDQQPDEKEKNMQHESSFHETTAYENLLNRAGQNAHEEVQCEIVRIANGATLQQPDRDEKVTVDSEENWQHKRGLYDTIPQENLQYGPEESSLDLRALLISLDVTLSKARRDTETRGKTEAALQEELQQSRGIREKHQAETAALRKELEEMTESIQKRTRSELALEQQLRELRDSASRKLAAETELQTLRNLLERRLEQSRPQWNRLRQEEIEMQTQIHLLQRTLEQSRQKRKRLREEEIDLQLVRNVLRASHKMREAYTVKP